MITLSIIIPTLNSGIYLNKCLASIASQRFDDYEVIVVDSGSTDNTLEILKSCQISTLKILSIDELGIANALNAGFQVAEGKFFTWLNSDDFYLGVDSLQVVNNRYLSRGKIKYFCLGHFCLCDESGGIYRHLLTWNIKSSNLANGANIFTGSLFFHRDQWCEFEGFDSSYKVAFEYQLLKFLFAKYNLIVCNHFVAVFRVHDQQLSQRLVGTKIEEYFKIFPVKRNFLRGKFFRLMDQILTGQIFIYLFFKIKEY